MIKQTEKNDSAAGHLAAYSQGSTVVRLYRDHALVRLSYCATIYHDGHMVAQVHETTAAAALVSVGRVLGALLLSSAREALTNELADAIARDIRTFGGGE